MTDTVVSILGLIGGALFVGILAMIFVICCFIVRDLWRGDL